MGYPRSLQSVLKTSYINLWTSPIARLVLLERSEQRFTRAQDIEDTARSMARALPDSRRNGCSILIDMRSAPLRVDPSFEPAFARYRDETERGFERGAVLVESALGRVRAERMKNASRIPLAIVGSMDEALAFIDRVGALPDEAPASGGGPPSPRNV